MPSARLREHKKVASIGMSSLSHKWQSLASSRHAAATIRYKMSLPTGGWEGLEKERTTHAHQRAYLVRPPSHLTLQQEGNVCTQPSLATNLQFVEAVTSIRRALPYLDVRRTCTDRTLRETTTSETKRLRLTESRKPCTRKSNNIHNTCINVVI